MQIEGLFEVPSQGGEGEEGVLEKSEGHGLVGAQGLVVFKCWWCTSRIRTLTSGALAGGGGLERGREAGFECRLCRDSAAAVGYLYALRSPQKEPGASGGGSEGEG